MDQWFFLIVPDLPVDAPGQTNSVEFIKYAVKAGDRIDAGSAVAAVRVGEEIYIIEPVIPSKVLELPCEVGETIRVGNPVAKLGFVGPPPDGIHESCSRLRLAENQS